MGRTPTKITLRTYQVGFGDCFLLTFHYAQGDKHVLIDFGSTKLPAGAGTRMLDVANDIKDRVGDDLVAVVATHRHKDHISGFATSKGGKGPGDIIRQCKPRMVLLPWTEQPNLPVDATAPTAMRSFARDLVNMHTVAEHALEIVAKDGRHMAPTYAEEIEFIGDDNLANKSAIKNLVTMGQRKPLYLSYGKRPSALEKLLPGVKIDVLGPPTLEQTETISTQTSEDPDEFWQLQALATELAAGRAKKLFPRYQTHTEIPPDARWFCDRIDKLTTQQLLSIVRTLDRALNNTSLILLFHARGKRLLFPGDAQIETWRYALREARDSARNRRELAATDLYKVGHHGSRNATPRSLWDQFDKRSTKKTSGTRLKSVMSTLPGVHGHETRNTEVPRQSLADELERKSELLRTDKFKGKGTEKWIRDVEIDF